MQSFISPCIPDSHPHRIKSSKCHKNTVVSPDDGPIFGRNMWRLINILRTNCALRWFYLQDYRETHGQQNIKKNLLLCDFMCWRNLDALSVTQNCLDDVTQFAQIRSERPTVLATANSNTAYRVKGACAIYRAKIPQTCLRSLELNLIASSIFAIFALWAKDSPYT